MSKAGRLAMELAQERKRLREELEQLQQDFDDISPVTPTGTPDWYIKWVAVVAGVSGIFLQAAGVGIVGQAAYLVGAIAWTVVGIYWNDRAVLIGSLIPATATALSITQHYLGG